MIFKKMIFIRGLGIGDWGLGVLGLGPKPQTKTHKPQNTNPKFLNFFKFILKIN